MFFENKDFEKNTFENVLIWKNFCNFLNLLARVWMQLLKCALSTYLKLGNTSENNKTLKIK